MPVYEYKCKACGATQEVFHRMHGEEAPVCEKCGAKALERLISLSSFRLTGKGWYTTDYNGKNASTQK